MPKSKEIRNVAIVGTESLARAGLPSIGRAGSTSSRRTRRQKQIINASGKPVDTGKSGELVARGANVMRRYWNNPKESALAFHNGMFRTGDVGYQDSDGYCYILDRLKDMIVTGGEKVYSGLKQSFAIIPRFMRRRSSEYLIPSGAKSWRLALC